MAQDERITQNEAQKNAALNELEKTYGNMISESDAYYKAQIDAAKEWADTQSRLQQERTDHTISVIEQEKENTTKDYKKEQSGAYVDWQKESNRYGANAEYMAANGLAGSGYSESSQVSVYNTYQNRYATARESWTRAIQNYNNQITEAKLQNSAVLAEIAYQALQTELQLSLEGFQYKSQLQLDLVAQKQNVDNSYWGRYTDILDQINNERNFAEQQRQFNESMAEEKRQFDATNNLNQAMFDYEKEQDAAAAKASSYSPTVPYSVSPYDTGSGTTKISSGSTSKTTSSSTKTSNGVAQIDTTYGTKFNVNTDYYRGDLNPDAKIYGVHSNGYQPKGISGHGLLHKTYDSKGVVDTFVFETKTLSGKSVQVEQYIWRADDGTKWYWEGRKNCYLPYPPK